MRSLGLRHSGNAGRDEQQLAQSI